MVNQAEQQVSSVIANGHAPQAAELAEKSERIAAFLDRHGYSALLLSRHENIAWATAGQVEARVALGSEAAVTSLLITREGRKYYLAPENEGPRLAAEEFAGLDYEPVLYPWYESAAPHLKKLTGGKSFASDAATADATQVNLGSLRAPLLPTEINRLRALGRDTADATVSVLESLEPGVTEYEMAARTSAALLERGIAPTVLLMGTDDRIRKYKHAVPRKGVLEHYGMVNLCARKWGLVVSITRFVHFGSVPKELAASFTHAAQINAELLHATRPGATSAAIFAVAKKAYAAAGVPEEIERHHQGGPCGYVERDWVITPHGEQTVALPQAFAYNPSLRGAKAEDTVLVTKDGVEVLTGTPSLPVIESEVGGKIYRAAGVLVK
ncbi:antitoxin VapB [Silvibacterium bohemicum]|uniref:Antitoxin VapB n=1 Tax=Silvibacterium bohemicum TaxID=1577686 RepID=A0A841K3H1_9BACT|nr:M24 family metallopeptidase [Silvibacterium bohemicum]MBB6147107.1 antitoxin VapB [Silvibacterium bohemicum]